MLRYYHRLPAAWEPSEPEPGQEEQPSGAGAAERPSAAAERPWAAGAGERTGP